MDFIERDKITHIQQRLAETIAWCTSQDWSTNLAEGLRTELFRPSEQASIQQTFPNDNHIWDKTPEQRQQIVEDLALKRATLLHTQGISLPQMTQPLTSGRLLVYNPEITLFDGASAVATDYFFDDDDLPAWDTWIAYATNDPPVGTLTSNVFDTYQLDSYLLSWVPEQLVEIAEAGIMVNCTGCIMWATDLDRRLIRQLKQTGLLR